MDCSNPMKIKAAEIKWLNGIVRTLNPQKVQEKELKIIWLVQGFSGIIKKNCWGGLAMCQEWAQKMPTMYIHRETVERKWKLKDELLETDVEKRNCEMNTESKQMLCFLELGIELGNWRGRWGMFSQTPVVPLWRPACLKTCLMCWNTYESMR